MGEGTIPLYRCPSERRQINRRLNLWHPGSKYLPSDSVNPFPRVMSRSKKGERDWNSEPTLPSDEYKI